MSKRITTRKLISRTFLTGLVTIVPITVTLYVLVWLATSAESLLGRVIRYFLPEQYYWPGMGLLVGILLIFSVGILMRAWAVRRVFAYSEAMLYRLPLIKSLYGAIRDFLGFFSESKKDNFRQVVKVNIGETGMHLIGFVTRSNFNDLPDTIGTHNTVAVYFPMSYQIGGYTVMMPRSAIEPVNMTMEEAMKFVVTAGMTVNNPVAALTGDASLNTTDQKSTKATQ